jgi:hypothetical protein
LASGDEVETLKTDRLPDIPWQMFGIIDRQVRAMTRLVEDVLDRFEVRLGHLYHSSDLLRPRREAV